MPANPSSFPAANLTVSSIPPVFAGFLFLSMKFIFVVLFCVNLFFFEVLLSSFSSFFLSCVFLIFGILVDGQLRYK